MANDEYFHTRLLPDPRREILWRTLYRHYFSRLIAETDCVLELGAGYGHFINQVAAKKAVALDRWNGFAEYLRPGIEARIGDVTDLSFLASSSIDFVFASNLFEHISQAEFGSVLRQLRRVLTPGGTLNILQPNYYYSYREYFDDYTHCAVYSHVSICDFLNAHGFRILECRPRFLPLTVKSGLPVSPFLIYLYLNSPWKPFGKQMFVRAGQT
ncbi:MAG: class I SAM-dependent methyltransferase [Alphaproteobacteria bacterium]|nr:class I SAM-dependent methyltransferase [Alphaproteobacteria bacterium]